MSRLTDEMQFLASATQRLIKTGRRSGLTDEQAVTAALIGAISVIRVDKLDEQRILQQVLANVPRRLSDIIPK